MSRSDQPASLTAALTAIVGKSGLRVGDELDAVDPGMHPQNLAAGLMVRPASTAEVARVLILCSEAGVSVVPQGGRTGLSGAASTQPGELILSLDRMNQIENVDTAARTATVEAGVTLARLEEALAPHGLAAGIDLGARGTATIGGMVATNAGGIDAFRYGTMRHRVLGLEAVLAGGDVLTELSRIRKDNAGLPLRQLFIGSEGTLGVITRVVAESGAGGRPAPYRARTAARLGCGNRVDAGGGGGAADLASQRQSSCRGTTSHSPHARSALGSSPACPRRRSVC